MSSALLSYILLNVVVFSVLAQLEEGDPLMKSGSRPYVSYEFTVLIRARTEECFHQYISTGATLNIEYEVLSSAGRNYDIDFILKAPNGAILKEIPDEEDGSYKTMIMRKGVYTLCFDNGFSKFTSKQLYLELTIVQRGEWKKYMEMQREQIIAEVNAIEGEVVASAMENVTEAMIDKLDYIADHMDSISFLQGTGRRRAIRDWHLANSNHSYIQKWSIAQCIVIVSASVFQVFLLRRMFNIKAVTPTQKPRA